MTLKLDRLNNAVGIVDNAGRPTVQFQILMQRAFERIEAAINDLATTVAAVAAAQAAADAANTAADAAQTAADSAQAAAVAAQAVADDATETSALAPSGVTGLTLTASDAGSNATITISAHTRVYGDGSQVSVNSGSVTGLAYSTAYYVFYVDASRSGGAVTYQASTNAADAAQIGDVHSLGTVTTPAALASPNPGKPNLPPGVVLP